MAAPRRPAEEACLVDGPEKLSPSTVNRMLMEFLRYFGRAMVLLYPVYVTGYLGLSISWVLLCMVMATWWKKNRQWKDARIGTAIEFVNNETQVVHKELRSALQMASWKVDWVNKVLEQAWPFFGMYMEKLLKENIQPAVRLSSPALKTFSFTKIHFGHVPLRITGLRAYTHEVDQREVILDMNIRICSLILEKLVILEPLIGDAPLVGGVTFFFLRRPTLEINWTGATNLLDTPAFRLDTIMDIIASLMVLPNRMCVPLIDQVKVDQMRFPLPRGVVRVNLLEARDLVAKDTYMMGLVKGKSDPYATLRVGNSNFKSKTIKENLHPVWNEVYEFVVHEAPGQELELELYDEDTDKDDFMGRYNLDLGEVKREKGIQKVSFYLMSWSRCGVKFDPQEYRTVTILTQHLAAASTDGLACAMLAVYLDGASNLPLTKRTACPNSYVEFSIDQDVQKSKVVYSSKDPVWEEGFTFFVHDIKRQQLNVQVKEHEKKTQLGALTLPLSRLLNVSNMALDQRVSLERSGANSQIKLKVTLRILTMEKPPPKIIPQPPPQAKQQGPQMDHKGHSPESTPSVATSSPPALSSNAAPAAQFSTATREADFQSGVNGEYLTHRRGSFLASDTNRLTPSTSNMRRFDSHSLLSENSIASSRFDISEGAPYPEAIRNHQGSFGEIHLTVRHASLRNKLIIVVEACRNLFRCSENGTDSYVRLYLLPDQSWRHRKRTGVKKGTVNPVFNHKFEFDVSLQEVRSRKLDVSVKNNKMLFTRERKDIGMVGNATHDSLFIPGTEFQILFAVRRCHV
uniref:C2 domain-containing protein n=1 Tax=Mola mola TaxID=94237 RepID=A0A3Q3W519_MOLML